MGRNRVQRRMTVAKLEHGGREVSFEPLNGRDRLRPALTLCLARVYPAEPKA
jgi:hypothetical protein